MHAANQLKTILKKKKKRSRFVLRYENIGSLIKSRTSFTFSVDVRVYFTTVSLHIS